MKSNTVKRLANGLVVSISEITVKGAIVLQEDLALSRLTTAEMERLHREPGGQSTPSEYIVSFEVESLQTLKDGRYRRSVALPPSLPLSSFLCHTFFVSVSLSVCICLSICLSVSVSLYPSFSLYLSLSLFLLSVTVCLSVGLPLHLCLPLRASVALIPRKGESSLSPLRIDASQSSVAACLIVADNKLSQTINCPG